MILIKNIILATTSVLLFKKVDNCVIFYKFKDIDPLQYFSLQLGHYRVGPTPHISEGGLVQMNPVQIQRGCSQ